MEKISVWLIILVAWLIARAVGAAKAKNKGKTQQQSATAARRPAPTAQMNRPAAAQRQTPSVQMNRPAPAMKRQTPSAARSAHRDFSAPEAPCIVCEQTGDDHFQRDKARRLAQLDDWLKIGLIDRDEYRVLRYRYERGI